jgi:hypothetical protein
MAIDPVGIVPIKRYCRRRGLLRTGALNTPALAFGDCYKRYAAGLIERMMTWEAGEVLDGPAI